MVSYFFFFFKQKTAYEMRISDWSSDVCSSDLEPETARDRARGAPRLALPEPVAVPSLTLDWRPGSCPSQSACRVQSCRSRLNRSEESRVGKECVSTCRSRWSPFH